MNAPLSTVAETTAILRERIMETRLAIGARLHQQAIADDLGVTRAVAAEALRILSREGLVIRGGNAGPTRVAPLDAGLLRVAYAMRTGFDGLATRLATEHAGPGLETRLRSHLDEQRGAIATAAPVRFMRADVAFHGTLVQAAGDPALTERWPALLASLRWVGRADDAQMRRIVLEHEGILTAVLARTPEAAEAAARAHVSAAVDLIEVAFG